jgi:hypothetical protein
LSGIKQFFGPEGIKIGDFAIKNGPVGPNAPVYTANRQDI